MDGEKTKLPLRGALPSPGDPPVVFFCSPPYILRIDVLGEAGRHRPVCAAQDDHARIAHEVQRVARWQAGSRVVLAHQEEEEEEFAGGRRGCCIPLGPWRSRPRYARPARRNKQRVNFAESPFYELR
jgi:hypothetical protein